MNKHEREVLKRIPQGSAEWLQARCGKVTASNVVRVINFLKNGKSSQDRENYKAEVISELLTSMITEHWVSPAMDWGSQNEKVARAEYELATGFDVDISGIWVHPLLDRFSGSPDGTIGLDGGLEIKCPNTATHIKWMRDGMVPEEHRWQMYACMACCEDEPGQRQWWDFASFDPRLPERYRLFIKRLPRDGDKIAELEAGVTKFWEEVLETIQGLESSCQPLKAKLRAAVNAVPTDLNDDYFAFIDKGPELVP